MAKQGDVKSSSGDATHRLGPLLAQLRQKQGYSLQKLAQASGVSAAYICRLESGERHPTRERLQSLTAVLIPDANQTETDELLIAAGFAPVNFRNFMGRQDVLEIFQKAHAANPDDFTAYIALVLSLIRSGQHDAARKHITEGMQRFDDMVQLQALMAVLELSKQNFAQAIRFQQEAIRCFELHPQDQVMKQTDLLLSLGVMHFEQGNGFAYARLRALADGSLADAEQQTRLAAVSLQAAAGVFEQALDIDPNDVYIQDELARVHFTLAYIKPGTEGSEHWRASIVSFERTLCSPDKHELGYQALLQSTAFLALAYSKCGDFAKAWFTSSIVEACLPNYWLIHYVKACYYGLNIQQEHQGRRDQATEPLFQACLQALDQAVSIDDSQNRAREEALIDPDLAVIRKTFPDEFQAIISKEKSKA